jgi:hypothetical protein
MKVAQILTKSNLQSKMTVKTPNHEDTIIELASEEIQDAVLANFEKNGADYYTALSRMQCAWNDQRSKKSLTAFIETETFTVCGVGDEDKTFDSLDDAIEGAKNMLVDEILNNRYIKKFFEAN